MAQRRPLVLVGGQHSELPSADLIPETAVSGMGARMVVCLHGADASTVRPTTDAVVCWIGSAEPTNAATNDIWVH